MKIIERKIESEIVEKAFCDEKEGEIWVKPYYSKKLKRVRIHDDFYCIIVKKNKEYCFIDSLLDLEDNTKMENVFRAMTKERIKRERKGTNKDQRRTGVVIGAEIYEELKMKKADN